MRKTLLVFGYELGSTFRRRSYLFATFAIPLIIGVILLGLSSLQRSAPSTPAQSTSAPTELLVEGYVDHAGLIQMLSPDVPPGTLIPYENEAQAQQALRAGEITAYYVIPADYIASGDLIYINSTYRRFGYRGQGWVMRNTISFNLLGGDLQRLDAFWHVMEVEVKPLAPQVAAQDDDGDMLQLPYYMGMFLYVTIVLASSLLRGSAASEKKDCVLEIVLSSVRPRQLLFGKLLALGLAGLVTTVVWLGTALALSTLGSNRLSLPSWLQLLDLPLVLWTVLFFLLGYAVYASLLAGLGALTGSNVPGSSTADIVVIWPLIIPMALLVLMQERPDMPLVTILSLIPLTSPIAMPARLTAGSVPLWQVLLSVALLIGLAALAVIAVARALRAQNLLSGQPFSVRSYLRILWRGT